MKCSSAVGISIVWEISAKTKFDQATLLSKDRLASKRLPIADIDEGVLLLQ